jgi:hypothetical protein
MFVFIVLMQLAIHLYCQSQKFYSRGIYVFLLLGCLLCQAFFGGTTNAVKSANNYLKAGGGIGKKISPRKKSAYIV